MFSKNKINILEGKLLPAVMLFAIPLMLSSVLQLLFNAADVVVVGKFAGENSLAAVGSNTSLINLLTNLFMGMATATNVLVAQHIGAGRRRQLRKTLHTSISLGVISGVILAVIGILFAKQILTLMSTPPEVIDLSATYLRVYFAGSPAIMVYNFGSAIMRAKGDTKRPLYYLVISGVVNVILNLLFVICFKMDVFGVALATIISQTISALLIIRALVHDEDEVFRPSIKELRPDKQTLIRILRIGLPAGIQGMVFSLSNVVIQSSINSFGAIVVAGNAAAANIEGFVWVAMNSFCQTALTFTGQNLGAGKFSRINKILFTTLACETLTGLILGITMFVFYHPLLSLYSDSPEVIHAGYLRLKYICCVYAIGGMMDCMVGSLRGMGSSMLPTVVSMVGACGLRLLWIATIFQIPQFHTCEVLYLSYAVSWAITFLAHVVSFKFVRRKFPKTEKETPSAALSV